MSQETYIVILRGINLGGNTTIKMAELKKMFEKSGFGKVKTYIQSGNVLFNYKHADTVKLARQIEKEIETEFKMKVPVIALELKMVQNVLGKNPFLKERNEDATKLHVTFLSDDADKVKMEKIERDKYLPDEFIFDERAIYLFCPNGYGRTKLTNNFFESKLKLTATTRNWKTINELVRLGEELAETL